jgi:hypothetical protein
MRQPAGKEQQVTLGRLDAVVVLKGVFGEPARVVELKGARHRGRPDDGGRMREVSSQRHDPADVTTARRPFKPLLVSLEIVDA